MSKSWAPLISVLCCVIFLSQCVHFSEAGRVLEMSDRFLEVYKEGVWIVMFYAPWCGHCKKLDPIWNNVAQTLYSSGIRVGRIDCTRFSAVATEFKVKGFPTILFMKEGRTIPYNGDRAHDAIVEFAQRMTAPIIQDLNELSDFQRVNDTRKTFFAYVGEKEGLLWRKYSKIAEEFQPFAWFYAVSEGCALQKAQLTKLPAVVVFKDSTYDVYEEPNVSRLKDAKDSNGIASENELSESSGDEESSLEDLRDFVNKERFPLFVRITSGNFHQVMQTDKYIVIAVLEEDKVGHLTPPMHEFKDELYKVAMATRDRFQKKFLFGWIGSPTLANSIAMKTLPIPSLLVINSSTYHHHIPDEEPEALTSDAITLFLENILAESVTVYGGTGILVRFYRVYYDAKTTLQDMWQGNPVLVTVLLGLPVGFLSLICYSICCSDMLEEDDEETHEKKE